MGFLGFSMSGMIICDAIQILAGARIEDETIEKQNLLHLAVIYERTYLINFLLENGASTSHQDHKFETRRFCWIYS